MTPILGIMASQISGHLATYAYDSIQTVTVGSGGQATVSFTSIPATYTHLQVRGIGRNSSTGTAETDTIMRYNSDTATNYTIHYLQGNGATVAAVGAATRSDPRAGYTVDGSALANSFGVVVADILDYANTAKYKTTRVLGADDRNGAGIAILESSVWMSTSAINRIDLTVSGGTNFAQYSSFALYGIRG